MLQSNVQVRSARSAVAAFAAGLLMLAGFALGNGSIVASNANGVPVSGFFDWSTPPAGTLGYTNSPFLNDSNAAQVAKSFADQLKANKNAVLAVKIVSPLAANGPAMQIFKQYNVQYVILDLEESHATTAAWNLVHSLAGTKSKSASVMNFNYYAVPAVYDCKPTWGQDPTRPCHETTTAASFSHVPTACEYYSAHLNTAAPACYPGSPDIRNLPGAPGLPNNQGAGPNVRTDLFVLPIERVTLAFKALSNGQTVIPYVARFNNWGNGSLDTDHNPSNGYRFVQNAAVPSQGQLPSRGDFQAQILHDRLRGASTYTLFTVGDDTGVVGYNGSQERQDASKAWTASNVINSIFASGHYALANLSTSIVDEQGHTDSEHSGVVWSGVYSVNGKCSQPGKGDKLVILLSNLDAKAHKVNLAVDGRGALSDDDYRHNWCSNNGSVFTIEAGAHRMLTFNWNASINEWVADTNTLVFTDDNRNGVGVPEPKALSLVVMAGAGLLAHRRGDRRRRCN